MWQGKGAREDGPGFRGTGRYGGGREVRDVLSRRQYPVALWIAGAVLVVLGATVATLAELAVPGLVLVLLGVAAAGLYGARAPRLPAGYVPPSAALAPSCGHRDAVPVDLLLTAERVAWWCDACKTQLGAGFEPPPDVPAPPGTGRRHWHAGSANCASCAGSDASGSVRCLCGECTGLAAASVMGPPADR